MCASTLQTAALAYEYDIASGDVHVENNDAGETVSWQDRHEQYNSRENSYNHSEDK